MKKLLSFPQEYILNKIFNSKELSEKFDNYISDVAMDYVSDKLACFSHNAVDYSIGVYNSNYFRVKDAGEFLIGVFKSIRNFGSSEELEKLCNLCEKLQERGSNLYEYHVCKLAEMYFEQELEQDVKYAEGLSFAIYQKDETNKDLLFQLENFEWELDNIYVDSQDKLCYMKYC